LDLEAEKFSLTSNLTHYFAVKFKLRSVKSGQIWFCRARRQI